MRRSDATKALCRVGLNWCTTAKADKGASALSKSAQQEGVLHTQADVYGQQMVEATKWLRAILLEYEQIL